MTVTTSQRRTAAARGPGLPASGRTRSLRRRRLTNDLVAAAFLLPALFCFGYFAWWPLVKGLELSFQSTDLIDPAQWVGLRNFHTVFANPLAGTAVRNTLEYAFLALVIGFPLPLALAVLMSTVRRCAGLYRYLVYLPVILPPVVSVLLWKMFYDPDAGLFNKVLGLVGLGPYPWLQSDRTALLSLVLEATWAGLGGATLIYLAALTRVPPELYEAAESDGAGVWRRVWHVTLPQLRGITLLLLLMQLIGTLQVFTEPFVMTDGGPQNATVTVLLLIYRDAFVDGDYGAASALSLLLAVALSVLSAVYLRATRHWSES